MRQRYTFKNDSCIIFFIFARYTVWITEGSPRIKHSPLKTATKFAVFPGIRAQFSPIHILLAFESFYFVLLPTTFSFNVDGIIVNPNLTQLSYLTTILSSMHNNGQILHIILNFFGDTQIRPGGWCARMITFVCSWAKNPSSNLQHPVFWEPRSMMVIG